MVTDDHKGWKIKAAHVDLEFARNSLREELEAINNYEARIEEASNTELKKVLKHNLDEEKEHAAMLLDWIRKADKTQGKAFEHG